MKYLFLIGLAFLLSCRNEKTNIDAPAISATVTTLPDAKQWNNGWKKDATVIVHFIAEPADLHPTNGNTSPRAEINLYTQLGLFYTNYTGSGMVAGLLEKMPDVSDDGLEYTCMLRKEPKWDNGEQLTSHDVEFTIKANCCPLTNNPHTKGYWNNFADVILFPDNNRKFKLILKQKLMQNLAILSDMPVMQEKFYDGGKVLAHYSMKQFNDSTFDANEDLKQWADNFNNEKYGRQIDFLNGIGMYKVTSWEAGSSIILEKKKNHWTSSSKDYHEASFPEKIIFKVNKDDNAQMLEFINQSMDVSANVSMKTLNDLRTNSGFNTNYHGEASKTYNYAYIAMNMKPDGVIRKSIFNDVKLRRAFAMATPVSDLLKLIYGNFASQSRQIASPVSPLKKECDTTLLPVAFDLKKASQLLEDAGWKDSDGNGVRDKMVNGQRTELIVDLHYLNTNSDWKDMSALCAENYTKIGAKINLTPLDLKVFVEKGRSHDFDMMMGVWGGTSQNEDYTQLWHTSSWVSNGSNYPGFGNAVSDALIDSIKYCLDETQRIKLVMALQKIIYDEQPMVFLYTPLRRNIIHRRFFNATLYSERPGILINNLKPGFVTNEVNN